MSQPLEIRAARPDDVGPIAELMYSSGPEIYDFLYGNKAIEFIRYEFAQGSGVCGWRNVTVAVKDGRVVGTGCFYDKAAYNPLTMGSARNIFRFFGPLGALPVVWRARHTNSIMKPPRPGELYLANFGVDATLRSQGIGSTLIRSRLEQARQQGYKQFGLDVAVTNPRGQALYERLGMQLKREKQFSAANSGVPGCRKMELLLG